VVPIEEVDHWIDLDPDLAAHLAVVAQRIGRAQQAAFSPARVGLIVAGMEVPHTHLHVIPIDSESDLHFANARALPDEEMDAAAQAIRDALGADGAS
jgi:diadenosine tetraphosphate (Ap4A) HIT family hydrolase